VKIKIKETDCGGKSSQSRIWYSIGKKGDVCKKACCTTAAYRAAYGLIGSLKRQMEEITEESLRLPLPLAVSWWRALESNQL